MTTEIYILAYPPNGCRPTWIECRDFEEAYDKLTHLLCHINDGKWSALRIEAYDLDRGDDCHYTSLIYADPKTIIQEAKEELGE